MNEGSDAIVRTKSKRSNCRGRISIDFRRNRQNIRYGNRRLNIFVRPNRALITFANVKSEAEKGRLNDIGLVGLVADGSVQVGR